MADSSDVIGRWEASLGLRWYAVVNDLVGGWAVANVDKPLSACGDLEGEILDMTTEEVARHVAEIHNDWLYRKLIGGCQNCKMATAQMKGTTGDWDALALCVAHNESVRP